MNNLWYKYEDNYFLSYKRQLVYNLQLLIRMPTKTPIKLTSFVNFSKRLS